ncbi:MAG: heme-binding protein [Xanthobacteraceae bacterium]|jgi:uncharacterized protein GlcG (DUF336 family)
MMKLVSLFHAPFCAFAVVVACAAPARADNVLTTHRLGAGLAVEAVTEAVAACAKEGYKVTATVVDTDGVTQAMLRGDGATITALDASHDKAYTVLMLGAPRGEEANSAVSQRLGATPSPGGLAKLPHILLTPGAVVIKAGGEAIAAIGVGGAPGGDLDEACAKAGLDKISDRLK